MRAALTVCVSLLLASGHAAGAGVSTGIVRRHGAVVNSASAASKRQPETGSELELQKPRERDLPQEERGQKQTWIRTSNTTWKSADGRYVLVPCGVGLCKELAVRSVRKPGDLSHGRDAPGTVRNLIVQGEGEVVEETPRQLLVDVPPMTDAMPPALEYAASYDPVTPSAASSPPGESSKTVLAVTQQSTAASSDAKPVEGIRLASQQDLVELHEEMPMVPASDASHQELAHVAGDQEGTTDSSRQDDDDAGPDNDDDDDVSTTGSVSDAAHQPEPEHTAAEKYLVGLDAAFPDPGGVQSTAKDGRVKAEDLAGVDEAFFAETLQNNA